MTAAWVREHYRVPAKRGMRVIADGRPGKIVGFAGAAGHLRIRLDGSRYVTSWHPTWRIEYLPEQS